MGLTDITGEADRCGRIRERAKQACLHKSSFELEDWFGITGSLMKSPSIPQ